MLQVMTFVSRPKRSRDWDAFKNLLASVQFKYVQSRNKVCQIHNEDKIGGCKWQNKVKYFEKI